MKNNISRTTTIRARYTDPSLIKNKTYGECDANEIGNDNRTGPDRYEPQWVRGDNRQLDGISSEWRRQRAVQCPVIKIRRVSETFGVLYRIVTARCDKPATRFEMLNPNRSISPFYEIKSFFRLHYLQFQSTRNHLEVGSPLEARYADDDCYTVEIVFCLVYSFLRNSSIP